MPAVRPSAARTPVIELRAAVLLDGVTESAARPYLDLTRKIYAEVGIDFVPIFRTITGLQQRGDEALTDEVKAVFGGKRPAWAHVVYVLTKKDLNKPDGSDTVAGSADCIGGVRTPETAFAVG